MLEVIAFVTKLDGDPGRIRTCNPQSRNLMLYPVELRDRLPLISTGNMKNPLRSQASSEPKPLKLRPRRTADRRVGSALNATPPATGQEVGTVSAMPQATFSAVVSPAI